MLFFMVAAAIAGSSAPPASASSAPPVPPPPPVAEGTPGPVPAPAPAPAPAPVPDASIGFFTAEALVRKCQDNSPASISYCYAYITAVHDSMKAYEIWLNQREFCMAAVPAQADLRRAFLTYISAYPENGSGQAASVVAVALRQTYVCAPSPEATPAGAGAPSGGASPRRP